MRASREQMKIMDRLKARSDFLRIQREGVRWVSQGFIFQATPNDLGRVRIGYTVSKKTEKTAVGRNRIKRRLRAMAAGILPVKAKTGTDIVLIGRPAAATRPFAELERDLIWCLRKTGHLKSDD